MTAVFNREDWFDSPAFQLTPWAEGEVRKAKDKIARASKPVKEDYAIVESKFRCSPRGRVDGYGLMVLPK